MITDSGALIHVIRMLKEKVLYWENEALNIYFCEVVGSRYEVVDNKKKKIG